jgi:tetratricopeptide (TPR) repeat protein
MVNYVGLEIHIRALQAAGYPVDVTCDAQKFPTGHLRPDVLPWVSSQSDDEDGRRLFALLFADEGPRAGWLAAGTAARRISLQIDSEAPELHRLPWELLRDPAEGAISQTVAADADTPFSRFLAVRQRRRPPLAKRPIKMLVAVASPANLAAYGLAPLDILAEQTSVAGALAHAAAGEVSLRFVPQPVTLAALERHLGADTHVLHLVAHGVRAPDGRAALFLASDTNQVERVEAADLASLMERRGGALRLATLACCETATGADRETLSGIAPSLVAAGVPVVVAFQGQIKLEEARAFTEAFYPELFASGQVDLAGNIGRSALISQRAGLGYALPVLYSRVVDGLLFTPRRREPFWTRARKIGAWVLAIISTLAMVLGLIGDMRPYCQPGGLLYRFCRLEPSPMPDGFNIVITEFGVQHGQGPVAVGEPGSSISELLFNSLSGEMVRDASTAPMLIRGPAEAGQLSGANREAYGAAAARATEQQNATILVYGVVVSDSTSITLDLSFHVRDPGFSFGAEAVGPERLGQPIPISLPVDAGSLAGANSQLQARIDVLRWIVAGLGEFRVGNYDAAYDRFTKAALIPRPGRDEGLDLVNLLKGAVRLRQADRTIDQARRTSYLDEAERAFDEARRLRPGYARSYLGLGAVAIAKIDVALATSDAPPQHWLPAMLATARQHYQGALQAAEKPAGAFVEPKVNYGLGQIEFVGAMTGLPGFSLEQAATFFTRVAEAYTSSGSPDLRWLAGHAHGQQAYIARLREDWASMADESTEAISVLSRLSGQRPRAFIALYWTYLAFARQQLGDIAACREAYDHALAEGEGYASKDDMERWRTERSCGA